MSGLDRLYNKKLRYEHHHLNFQESILRDVTPFVYESRRNLVLHQNRSMFCHNGKKY